VLPLAVTVSSSARGGDVEQARALAARWGLSFVARERNAPLQPLLEREAEAFLVVSGRGLSLEDGQGRLAFAPGMAQLRIKRLDAGAQEDLLVTLGELKPGDTVLDATLGLAADALVASRVVGATGAVLAYEKSLPLAVLAAEALGRPWREGYAPITVEHADSARALEALPRGHVDVVLFDPMFGRPNKASPDFELLRRFADASPLLPQTLAQAQRVARRWVLVKGSRYSKDFRRLGLTAVDRSLSRGVLWARVPGGA
jgi:predicted RNA methylase